MPVAQLTFLVRVVFLGVFYSPTLDSFAHLSRVSQFARVNLPGERVKQQKPATACHCLSITSINHHSSMPVALLHITTKTNTTNKQLRTTQSFMVNPP